MAAIARSAAAILEIDGCGLFPLMSAVDRGPPRSALDRVAHSIEPADSSFAFSSAPGTILARPWRDGARRWPPRIVRKAAYRLRKAPAWPGWLASGPWRSICEAGRKPPAASCSGSINSAWPHAWSTISSSTTAIPGRIASRTGCASRSGGIRGCLRSASVEQSPRARLVGDQVVDVARRHRRADDRHLMQATGGQDRDRHDL